MNDLDASQRRRRRWPIVLAALLVLAGVVAGLAWRYRTTVAEQGAAMALAALDLGMEVDFRVAEIDAGFLRLEDIRIGDGGLTAASAEVAYSPGGLMAGRVLSVRLIAPVATIEIGADGAIAIDGLPRIDDGGASTGAFPALPDVDGVDIVDGVVRVATPDFRAEGAVDASLVKTASPPADGPDGPRSFALNVDAALTDAAGRRLTLAVPDAALAYASDRVALTGVVDLALDDGATASAGDVALWIDAAAEPTGALDLLAYVLRGKAARGDAVGLDDLRGRVIAALPPGAPPRVQVELQADGVRVAPAAADLGTVAFELAKGDARLGVDLFGDAGALGLTLASAAAGERLEVLSRGEVRADVLASLLPTVTADGRVRFEGAATLPTHAFLADPDYRLIEGEVTMAVEMPKLSIADFAPEGSAFGEAKMSLKEGAATITAPGLLVGGVQLPPATVAALPSDMREALSEPAFLRLGGEGLETTIMTVFERPEGGLAAFGKLGLGVSNPKLALFIEGGANAATDADGRIETFESDRLTIRLVDAELGAARVGGEALLVNVSGAGDAYTAEATLALSARVAAGDFVVEAAEIDMTGPLSIDGGEATLEPAAGGRIRFRGYSGPLISSRAPVSLTLTEKGARRVRYDRNTETLEADLDFRGFRTKLTLNPSDAGQDAGEIDLTLAGAGVRFDAEGGALILRDASATAPEYGLELAGADARIAIGADSEERGSLTIASIRHLDATPLMRPMSLRLDVAGKGDLLRFDGALIAAEARTRLNLVGEHHLATGVGEARLSLGPVVFAPGVLQPQDFAPSLYRILLETIGEAEIGAQFAWTPDGVTREEARLDVSLDKLRTSEITVENLSTTFEMDRLLSPRSAGAQRIRIGRLDVGVPLTLGVMDVNMVSMRQVDVALQRFELFGGVISSQRFSIDPTSETFEATLNVRDIDLASILAFAEFGELQVTGLMEGKLPIRYENGELRINGGLLQTGDGGGRLIYKPREVGEALQAEADRSTKLALQALANFAYEKISVAINEIDAEELRLDIFIKGKSLDVFGGLPIEFNIVVEGPLRQIIVENTAPPELPPDVIDLLNRRGVAPAEPAR